MSAMLGSVMMMPIMGAIMGRQMNNGLVCLQMVRCNALQGQIMRDIHRLLPWPFCQTLPIISLRYAGW